MAREGEIGYFDAIGDAGRRHALNKPWSDEHRGPTLQQVGALLGILPRPPAKVLELACGTGWLTWILQLSGYQATGIDVAPRAIELAQQLVRQAGEAHPSGVDPPTFLVSTVDEIPFDAEFDAAVFFDSLHHTTDEAAALRAVRRALKPGGIVITSEPGRGHAKASKQTMEKFDVTERDMPVRRIREAGEAAGLVHVATLPRSDTLGSLLYRQVGAPMSFGSRVRRGPFTRWLRVIVATELRRLDNGIVVLQRPAS